MVGFISSCFVYFHLHEGTRWLPALWHATFYLTIDIKRRRERMEKARRKRKRRRVPVVRQKILTHTHTHTLTARKATVSKTMTMPFSPPNINFVTHFLVPRFHFSFDGSGWHLHSLSLISSAVKAKVSLFKSVRCNNFNLISLKTENAVHKVGKECTLLHDYEFGIANPYPHDLCKSCIEKFYRFPVVAH